MAIDLDNIIAFKEKLKYDRDEEIDANRHYKSLAADAFALGMKTTGLQFARIAGDEARHAMILQHKIEAINKQYGV